MTIAWVLGSGGLLGSALCRRLWKLGTTLFVPRECFSWQNETSLEAQFAEAVHAFASALDRFDGWEIYWAAGQGTMGSPEAALAPETGALSHLLHLFEATTPLMAKPGRFAFASSAGAIYAGSKDLAISELTPPSPTTAYAREKLRQEDMLRMFAGNGRAVLIARLSTLYGRGQSRHKTQGLITHLARGIARNQVTQVYVPLDTIRDYIAADDAASEIVTSLRFPDMASKCTVKIIASEQATTIAQIVAVLKMIARRSPRIVTSSNNLGSLYSRRIRFHSVVEPCRKGPPATSLLVGIAQLLALERKAFARTSFRKRQEPGHQ